MKQRNQTVARVFAAAAILLSLLMVLAQIFDRDPESGAPSLIATPSEALVVVLLSVAFNAWPMMTVFVRRMRLACRLTVIVVNVLFVLYSLLLLADALLHEVLDPAAPSADPFLAPWSFVWAVTSSLTYLAASVVLVCPPSAEAADAALRKQSLGLNLPQSKTPITPLR